MKGDKILSPDLCEYKMHFMKYLKSSKLCVKRLGSGDFLQDFHDIFWCNGACNLFMAIPLNNREWFTGWSPDKFEPFLLSTISLHASASRIGENKPVFHFLGVFVNQVGNQNFEIVFINVWQN